MVFYMLDHDNSTELLLKLIRDLNATIVGISLFSTRRMDFKDICYRIRQAFPDIAIVCGGPDVNSNYLNVITWVDYVCVTDGEMAFPSLCEEIFIKKTSPQNIKVPNIYFKSDSEIVLNRIEVEINLDKYPFPYFSDEKIFKISSGAIFPYKDSQSRIYNIYASRGCPFKCTYCANHVFSGNFEGKNYRYRSVDNVIDEITSAVSKNANIKSITFHDEQFGANIKWLDEFSFKYKAKVNLPFFAQMNPRVINKEKIKKLKDIGLTSLSFGMQSASERIRKIYARPESLEQIRQANQILHEFKVNHFFDVITDNPYESIDDIEETVRFLLSLKKPFVAKTFDLVYLPSTKLTEMALKDNLITPDQIEGNFKYDKEIAWRVREKDVSLNTDEKYLVSLIQMTGNVLYPNMLLKVLLSLRKQLPEGFKRIFAKIVLTEGFYKSQVLMNAVSSLAYEKKYRLLLSKAARKIVKLLFK
jgi:radical SAM superfamily enzyme YgiQ (UPF0313 family)